MKTILCILSVIALALGQISTTSPITKAKIVDSVGNTVGTSIIAGKRALNVKIGDTVRIRDSAKVYAHVTDSVKIRGVIDSLYILESIKDLQRMDTLYHLRDSIKGYAKITDSVRIKDSTRGYAKITDTVPTRPGIKWIDTGARSLPFQNAGGMPLIANETYLETVSEGFIEGHIPWFKIGFTPTTGTSESDLWSGAGTITLITTPAAVVDSGTSNNDSAFVNFSGTANAAGTTVTLVDSTKNFNAGTAVLAGDCIILDKSGADPEFGFVDSILSNVKLKITGKFSEGGSSASRAYSILHTSSKTGAQAVYVAYLDLQFNQKHEIIITRGVNAVSSVNTDIYRVNSYQVISTGSLMSTSGTKFLKSSGTINDVITAGFTNARNSLYTVPKGYNLFITDISFSYAYESNSTHYARVYIRCTQFLNGMITPFRTPGTWHPYFETVSSNSSEVIPLQLPVTFLTGTDVKVSILATFGGISTVSLRGWLDPRP